MMKYLPWKLLGAAVFVGLAFDVLFFKTQYLGINVFLFELAFLGATLGLSFYLKHKIPTRVWVAAGFASLYAITFAIWTSLIGLVLSGIGFIFANLFLILFLLGHDDKFRHPFSIVSAHFKHTFLGVVQRISILDHFKLPGVSSKGSSIGRGILFAIPTLIIFFVLFVGADAVLEQNTEGFFDKLNDFLSSGDFVSHGFIILLISAVTLLLFAAIFWKRLEIPGLKEIVPKFKIESAVVLSSVTVLFFGFLLMQSVYLFGGEKAWNNIEGITYSEYAVNGFNELAAVAILVIGLILTLRYFHTRQTHKLVTVLESILLFETVLVVASAWIRMNLYVGQYGYTSPRLFGFWFFITIGITLALLFFNIVNKSSQIKFMRNATLFIGASMLIFTVSAPDALSLQLNLNRATEEEPFDPFPHFYDLSAEAYPKMNMVLKTNAYPIEGLIQPQPGIEEYCGWFKAQGNLRYENYQELEADVQVHYQINRWETIWNNFHYKTSRGGKGSPELKKQSWKTWNLSRSQVPHNEYDYNFSSNQVPYPKDELTRVCWPKTVTSPQQ